MHASDPVAELHYSFLAGDADLAELIELFVEELPQRIAALREAASCDDFAEVGRLSHQLKGAGGNHGFPPITVAAAEVQRLAHECAAGNELFAAVDRLREVCARCRGPAVGGPEMAVISRAGSPCHGSRCHGSPCYDGSEPILNEDPAHAAE
jgi:HPt (histidine-containing phosphotransfer) domain-containing protein